MSTYLTYLTTATTSGALLWVVMAFDCLGSCLPVARGALFLARLGWLTEAYRYNYGMGCTYDDGVLGSLGNFVGGKLQEYRAKAS